MTRAPAPISSLTASNKNKENMKKIYNLILSNPLLVWLISVVAIFTVITKLCKKSTVVPMQEKNDESGKKENLVDESSKEKNNTTEQNITEEENITSIKKEESIETKENIRSKTTLLVKIRGAKTIPLENNPICFELSQSCRRNTFFFAKIYSDRTYEYLPIFDNGNYRVRVENLKPLNDHDPFFYGPGIGNILFINNYPADVFLQSIRIDDDCILNKQSFSCALKNEKEEEIRTFTIKILKYDDKEFRQPDDQHAPTTVSVGKIERGIKGKITLN